MRVVVIGGSGFLGSHVADHLTAAGHSVVVYDIATSPWLQENQEMVVGDVNDSELLVEVLDGASVVFNFAAVADLDSVMARPEESARVNVLGNVIALEAARSRSIDRFVYASTMYASSREGGFYGCSKRAAEDYVREYGRRHDLDFTILRYGSLYGPRSDGANGLRNIVRNALREGRITYSGSPDAIREYIHVEDAARASMAALGDEFRSRTIVLTGLESTRMSDAIEMLDEILGLGGSVAYTTGEQPGHYVRTPYADRLDHARKYVPSMTVDLGQGLLELISEIRSEAAGE